MNILTLMSPFGSLQPIRDALSRYFKGSVTSFSNIAGMPCHPVYDVFFMALSYIPYEGVSPATLETTLKKCARAAKGGATIYIWAHVAAALYGISDQATAILAEAGREDIRISCITGPVDNLPGLLWN